MPTTACCCLSTKSTFISAPIRCKGSTRSPITSQPSKSPPCFRKIRKSSSRTRPRASRDSTLLESRRYLAQNKPDLVQRFVDASIIGWYNYIYDDNKAANALIKQQNPEMTDELLSYSVAKMKEYGIVDSGDALTLGVGAMTDARMKDFFDKMVRAGVTQAALDYRKSYTLRFVNNKVGLDLRPKQ